MTQVINIGVYNDINLTQPYLINGSGQVDYLPGETLLKAENFTVRLHLILGNPYWVVAYKNQGGIEQYQKMYLIGESNDLNKRYTFSNNPPVFSLSKETEKVH